MYGSLPSEKQPLLPVATPLGLPTPETEHEGEDRPAWVGAAEAGVLFTSLALLVSLILVLYFPHLIPSTFVLAPFVRSVSVGLQTSAWSSLPAPTALFIAAPHFARPERVALTRYTIFLFYLVGAALGALLFGGDLRAAVLEVGEGCLGHA